MNGARLQIFEAKDVSYEGDTKYVSVSFLPSREKTAKTVVAKRYGRGKSNPQWEEMLRLKPDKAATGLVLQLFGKHQLPP